MQRIHVSTNRRFLMTEDGQPFFWLADTAWELFHRCTLEEAVFYLENRRQKGFNVIQAVVLAELDGLRAPNTQGDVPFFDLDPRRPNEAYFRHVDDVIRAAEDKEMYIALLPTWGDKVVQGTWGAGPVIFNEQTGYHYGQWIGTRYRDFTNVLWVNGGDRAEPFDGVSYAPVWRALAAGVKNGAGNQSFMSYHPNGGHSSAEVFHGDNWLDMNMWQSGHLRPDIPNWEMIAQDYARVPVKPVIDGEPNYEDHPIDPFTRKWDPSMGTFRDADVRKQAYRAVLSGACGHTYGHHSIWQMWTPERAKVNFPDRPWREALDRPGAFQMGILRGLMESRPFFDRIPDQTLLASDSGEDAYHAVASRALDGAYALVFVPAGRDEIEINTGALSGERLDVYWFNPRTGEAFAAESPIKQARLRFAVPKVGVDWVLVLDDPSRNFAPPSVATAKSQ